MFRGSLPGPPGKCQKCFQNWTIHYFSAHGQPIIPAHLIKITRIMEIIGFCFGMLDFLSGSLAVSQIVKMKRR